MAHGDRVRVRVDRAHVLLAAAILALVSVAAFQHALFSRFAPHAPGQGTLMLLRGLVVASVFVAARGHARAPSIAAGAIGLMVLSFVVPGGVVLLTMAGIVALAVLPAVRLDLARPSVRELAFTACALALAVTMAVAISPRPYPELPVHGEGARESTQAWLAAGNPRRAHASALAWAKSEGADPGEGYLALAAIDRDLGYEGKARKVLEKVRTKSSSNELRRRAAALLGEAEP